MNLKSTIAVMVMCVASSAMAQEIVSTETVVEEQRSSSLLARYGESAYAALSTTRDGARGLLDTGLSFLGIKYRFGGNGPENGGFDCSGLVRKVFGDALGLKLPRTAAEMAKLGDKVGKEELKPGDLVFFNTMRRAFSHVGIYMGDNRFLHAPSKGGVVRVESLKTSYWAKRFNGGRRVVPEAQLADAPNLPVAELQEVLH